MLISNQGVKTYSKHVTSQYLIETMNLEIKIQLKETLSWKINLSSESLVRYLITKDPRCKFLRRGG